jgi:hypothetical protein
MNHVTLWEQNNVPHLRSLGDPVGEPNPRPRGDEQHRTVIPSHPKYVRSLDLDRLFPILVFEEVPVHGHVEVPRAIRLKRRKKSWMVKNFDIASGKTSGATYDTLL